jgi:hypothetical protein
LRGRQGWRLCGRMEQDIPAVYDQEPANNRDSGFHNHLLSPSCGMGDAHGSSWSHFFCGWPFRAVFMETVPVMPVSEKPPPRSQDAEISGMAMLWWCAAKQIGARWATSSRYGQPGMRKSHEPNPESSDWGDAPSSRPSDAIRKKSAGLPLSGR